MASKPAALGLACKEPAWLRLCLIGLTIAFLGLFLLPFTVETKGQPLPR